MCAQEVEQLLSLASEASREVANLTERNYPHTPVYGVKEFVRLSVCDKLLPQLSEKLNKHATSLKI